MIVLLRLFFFFVCCLLCFVWIWLFSFEYCFLFGLDWFGLFVFLVLASCLFVLTGCGALFCFFVVADVFVVGVVVGYFYYY